MFWYSPASCSCFALAAAAARAWQFIRWCFLLSRAASSALRNFLQTFPAKFLPPNIVAIMTLSQSTIATRFQHADGSPSPQIRSERTTMLASSLTDHAWMRFLRQLRKLLAIDLMARLSLRKSMFLEKSLTLLLNKEAVYVYKASS